MLQQLYFCYSVTASTADVPQSAVPVVKEVKILIQFYHTRNSNFYLKSRFMICR